MFIKVTRLIPESISINFWHAIVNLLTDHIPELLIRYTDMRIEMLQVSISFVEEDVKI